MTEFPPIEELLPHQPPMRLLDEVVAADAQGLWATVELRPDSPFVVNGRVRTLVALEYLAQAAAAWFAWRARQHADAAVRAGMLIACSRLDSRGSHFETGQHLWLLVEPVSRLPAVGSGMVKFRGQVFVRPAAGPSSIAPMDQPAGVEAEFSVYI